MFATKLGALSRNIATSAARSYKPHHGPGSNLPFRLDNHYRFVLIFSVFAATGFGLPFLVVRHQLLK